jgi:hypothetical protein
LVDGYAGETVELLSFKWYENDLKKDILQALESWCVESVIKKIRVLPHAKSSPAFN